MTVTVTGASAGPAARPVIIIFGAAVLRDGQPSRTLSRRVAAALRHGAGLADPLYMPSGAVGRHPPAEAEVMARLLREGGVDPAAILPEPTGTNTLSSVRACIRLRAQHPAARDGAVWAATSAYHLPRCLLLLRLAGLPARACPPPPEPAASRPGKRWYWRLRELPAVPVDAALLLGLRLRGRL